MDRDGIGSAAEVDHVGVHAGAIAAIDETGDIFGSGIVTEEFPTADQYTIQGDVFSKAVLEGGEVPVPLEDAIANMAVIEAVFKSAEKGGWVEVEKG